MDRMGVVQVLGCHGSDSARATLGSLTSPEFTSKIPWDSQDLKRSLLSDSLIAPPAGDQKPDSPSVPAPSIPSPGSAPAEGTRVLAGSSGAGSASTKASIESQLGAGLTFDKCQPDLPIFANIRGQWREASILFVRNSLVMDPILGSILLRRRMRCLSAASPQSQYLFCQCCTGSPALACDQRASV
jgi:hypothetical protein